MAFRSCSSTRISVSWPGVLGQVVDDSSARVSKVTYRRKRSRTVLIGRLSPRFQQRVEGAGHLLGVGFVDDQEIAPADGLERVAVAGEFDREDVEAGAHIAD